MHNPNRLLIVDDDAGFCSLVRDIAEEAGFLATEVSSRTSFDRLIASFAPSAIVLDLNMPETDAIEYLRALGSIRCTTPIIVVSGRDEKVLATARHLGTMLGLTIHQVMQKPVHAGALQAVLAELKTEPAGNSNWLPTPLELKQAIASGELLVHFEPKVDLQQSGFPVVGCEALVRWRHPQRGILLPEAFLPLAEQADLMGALVEAVLRFSVQQLADWQKAGRAVPVSIGLGVQQLGDIALPDRVAGMMAAEGLAPSLLRFDISERAVAANFRTALEVLSRLHLKNFAISLDDFGTGGMSLFDISRLPLAELKIDGSLVKQLQHDHSGHNLVRAMIAMAHELKLETCADGVESEHVARLLHGFGCDRAQGFVFGKAMPADEFTDWMARRIETQAAEGEEDGKVFYM